MDALAFLDKAKVVRQPLYVLFGEEEFLKQRCRDAILSKLLGDIDPSFAVSAYAGDQLDFRSMRTELDTRPFLGDARIVLVENAEKFVSENREQLEKYLEKPSSIGVLMLDVKTFPETTRLAKALPDTAKVSCKPPKPAALPGWCVGWAKSQHQKKMSTQVANVLIERVGPYMGMLAQEIAKLTSLPSSEITIADIEKYVARTRAANVFQILSALGQGKPDQALTILGQLFDEGQHALAILGALTSQLRKLAAVARCLDDGMPMSLAMDNAGMATWPQARMEAEMQIQQFGRAKLARLPRQLLEINFGLKGGSPLPDRLQMERLLVQLAKRDR